METIVVTGSTKGIGLGLARGFLSKGNRVVINGRNAQLVETVVERLQTEFGTDKVAGKAGDMSQFEDVKSLWNHAQASFGSVSIWINNAGIMNSHQHFWEMSEQELASIVNVNLVGSMYACKIVMKEMLQSGGGHIYNFEGFGSNGKQFHPFMTPYGATKSAIRYLSRSLAKEAMGTGINICTIAPGIVVTDLLKTPYVNRPTEWEKAKKIFNILGDHVETVTPFIVDEVLKHPKNGSSIDWLTFSKVLSRFASSLFSKRDLFSTAEIPQHQGGF